MVAFARDDAGLHLTAVDVGQTQIALLSSNASSAIGSKVDTDDGVYFTVEHGDTDELWKTDGTREGTMLVLDVPSLASPLATIDGNVVFLSLNGNTTEIWRTDGSETGTIHEPIVRSEHTGSSII